MTPKEVEWEGGLVHPEVLPDQSIISLGFRPTAGQLRLRPSRTWSGITGLRIEALTHGDLIFGGPGRNVDGLFAVSELVVEAKTPGSPVWTKIPLCDRVGRFRFARKADRQVFLHGQRGATPGWACGIIDRWQKGNSLEPGSAERAAQCAHRDRRALPRDAATATRHCFARHLEFQSRRQGASRAAEQSSRQIPCCSYEYTLSERESRFNRRALCTRNTIGATDTRSTRGLGGQPGMRTCPRWPPPTPRLRSSGRNIPEADTTILHVAQRSADDRRTTFLLDRGAWDKPKHAVTPGTPEFMHSDDIKQRAAAARLRALAGGSALADSRARRRESHVAVAVRHRFARSSGRLRRTRRRASTT